MTIINLTADNIRKAKARRLIACPISHGSNNQHSDLVASIRRALVGEATQHAIYLCRRG